MSAQRVAQGSTSPIVGTLDSPIVHVGHIEHGGRLRVGSAYSEPGATDLIRFPSPKTPYCGGDRERELLVDEYAKKLQKEKDREENANGNPALTIKALSKHLKNHHHPIAKDYTPFNPFSLYPCPKVFQTEKCIFFVYNVLYLIL